MKRIILSISMALALVAVFAAPPAALAADTVVSGNVVVGYSFTPPTAISLGDMNPGTTATGNSAGSLSGNNALGYSVKAIDAKGTNTGLMVSGAHVLTNKFKIGATSGSVANADVERTLLSTGAAGTDAVPLYVSQQVVLADPVASNYSITITYTVTAN
jgi:hypothetical protein